MWRYNGESKREYRERKDLCILKYRRFEKDEESAAMKGRSSSARKVDRRDEGLSVWAEVARNGTTNRSATTRNRSQ